MATVDTLVERLHSHLQEAKLFPDPERGKRIEQALLDFEVRMSRKKMIQEAHRTIAEALQEYVEYPEPEKEEVKRGSRNRDPRSRMGRGSQPGPVHRQVEPGFCRICAAAADDECICGPVAKVRKALKT